MSDTWAQSVKISLGTIILKASMECIGNQEGRKPDMLVEIILNI